MADIFNFYVYDDRTIKFNLAEPIMLEDKNVTQFQFRIPKILNELDMTAWSWWYVYLNARGEKYSAPLMLTDDPDDPDDYSIAMYTVDYGMSGSAGRVMFALEAIDTDSNTSEILHEWHTKTYSTDVIGTLQGNQIEFTESEIDVVTAAMQSMLEQVREMIEGGGGGGSTSDDITNESSVSGSTVTDALNALSGEIATKGTYSKPSGGIPKTDLASAVQTSLGKADTALQTAPVTSVNGATGAVVISTATTSANGLMSSTDKQRLDTVYADYSSALSALGV